ncbi:hypothetical protein TNIN_499071 [Trichonephila inaurata madagascariensis]|uniref:Uncharacterized protein n=1 Tax=Trichonephila inaurata madagascariensis TaxID=2747483 RepID=A0A8X6WRD3_9ARAC|nr:hypothetical protein TNIN_499071 [Trichonephila inaurata madagascariensis]
MQSAFVSHAIFICRVVVTNSGTSKEPPTHCSRSTRRHSKFSRLRHGEVRCQLRSPQFKIKRFVTQSILVVRHLSNLRVLNSQPSSALIVLSSLYGIEIDALLFYLSFV